MYKKLDILLSAETTIDAWYDDGWIIAGEILSEFRSQDWVELARNVLTKPLAWQKKLAYCLDSNCSLYELHLLLTLLQVEDEEVFAISIDTLRSFTDPESKKMIRENPLILERVNKLISTSGMVRRKIFEDFLEQIQQ